MTFYSLNTCINILVSGKEQKVQCKFYVPEYINIQEHCDFVFYSFHMILKEALQVLGL